MLIRVLLFALLASWLAACDSSSDGSTYKNDNRVDEEFSVSDEWDDIRGNLPPLGGYTDLSPNSAINSEAKDHYVLDPVMKVNRSIGQLIYESQLIDKLVNGIKEKDNAKKLYKDLFGEHGLDKKNHVRYRKQVKCLADIHEIELELQSLLAAAHDPALRTGVFTEDALRKVEAIKGEAEQVEYLLNELWLVEDGKSDLAHFLQQYRNKVAAFLVLPFGNEPMTSNAWACGLSDSRFKQIIADNTDNEESDFAKFAEDKVQVQWQLWQQNGEYLFTKENMAEQLVDLIKLVENARVVNGEADNGFEKLNLGRMNVRVHDKALIEEKDGVNEENVSDEGSIYRLSKLVCKGFFGQEIDENKDLCRDDLIKGVQITRDLNEQIASNVGNAMLWLAYDAGFARALSENSFIKKEASGLVRVITDLEPNYIRPLSQRAFSTLTDPESNTNGGGKGGCDEAGFCDRSLLVSVKDARDEDEVAEQKPGTNWENPDKKYSALPINDEHKNVLRKDRVEHAMNILEDGVKEYLVAVDDAVEELLGAWNHFITLLLISFGWLRLRNRRRA